MNTISISISDNSMARLQQLAEQTGLPPAKLVERRVESLLSQPDEELLRTMNQVLQKNAELYRRLA